jgi:hypothetical protein
MALFHFKMKMKKDWLPFSDCIKPQPDENTMRIEIQNFLEPTKQFLEKQNKVSKDYVQFQELLGIVNDLLSLLNDNLSQSRLNQIWTFCKQKTELKPFCLHGKNLVEKLKRREVSLESTFSSEGYWNTNTNIPRRSAAIQSDAKRQQQQQVEQQQVDEHQQVEQQQVTKNQRRVQKTEMKKCPGVIKNQRRAQKKPVSRAINRDNGKTYTLKGNRLIVHRQKIILIE